MTLKCSVYSDSEHKTCLERGNVHWFRAALDSSHADFIYTDEISNDRCNNRRDKMHQRSCVYSLSTNISVSDAGTYYCALATCGKIIFGNGTKLDVEGNYH